jgi:hypothetical protein
VARGGGGPNPFIYGGLGGEMDSKNMLDECGVKEISQLVEIPDPGIEKKEILNVDLGDKGLKRAELDMGLRPRRVGIHGTSKC